MVKVISGFAKNQFCKRSLQRGQRRGSASALAAARSSTRINLGKNLSAALLCSCESMGSCGRVSLSNVSFLQAEHLGEVNVPEGSRKLNKQSLLS